MLLLYLLLQGVLVYTLCSLRVMLQPFCTGYCNNIARLFLLLCNVRRMHDIAHSFEGYDMPSAKQLEIVYELS